MAEPAGYELGDAGLADPGYRDARPADPKRADPERADPKRAGAGQADAGQATQTVSGEAFLAAAEQATQAANWTAAEQLWRSMRILVPHMWYAHTGGATALCGLGRFAEARLLLSDAMTTFPWEHTIRHELGRLDARLGDWPAAEAHWRAALEFDTAPWWVYTELAGAIERQGRLSDAEEVLLDGQVRDPNEITLFTYAARLAWAREDWSLAVSRWAEARRRFPAVEKVASGLYQALMRLAEHDPAAADRAHRAMGLASVEVATEDDERALLLRFESLGGSGPDGGCEFGGVQRAHGAEPLGLFRWAAVSPPNLIACLEGRFAGIGDADTTTVYPHDDDPDALWQIGDTTYGTAMHSFVPSRDVPHERMMVLACKRMRYLKDKLIADLERPAKIFVLKVADRHLTVEETAALSRAILSYEPNNLLCVCPADPIRPQHKIVAAAPGVFIGYMDFSGRLHVEERHVEWAALCGTMLGMTTPGHDHPGPSGAGRAHADRDCGGVPRPGWSRPEGQYSEPPSVHA
ncbi:MAG: hypothetical protein ABSC06_35125 [Rhodopila sp.]